MTQITQLNNCKNNLQKKIYAFILFNFLKLHTPFFDYYHSTFITFSDAQECNDQWKDWFSKRTTKENHEQVDCCFQRKQCECINNLNSGGANISCKAASCEGGNEIPMSECMSLKPVEHPYSKGSFNWWWILVIIAIILILVIIVAIFFVYRKKFCGHESKEDRKHSRVTMGNMNVKSEVQWEGKHRKHHRGGSKHSKKGSKKSVKRGRSSQHTKHSTHTKHSQRHTKTKH